MINTLSAKTPAGRRKYRYIVAVFLPVLAAIIRLLFLQAIGMGTAFLTFYPAVMVAAIFGGFFCGLIATVISALLSLLWVATLGQGPYLMSFSDWLAMVVFLINCLMISLVCEAMLRAEEKLALHMEALTEARDEAQAANRAKSVFLANMSHELRTPLNAVIGFANLLQRNKTVPEEQRKVAGIIRHSGEHLLALINEVLDMAKIEAGRMEVQKCAFDLKTLILDTCDLIRARAGLKGLTLGYDQDSQYPRYVFGDAAKLRQIVINLLGNAIKYTETGGVIIRLNAQPLNEEALCLLTIEVEDTGIGIAKKDQQRIFEAFVQADAKQGSRGSGLGLSIVRQYLELMGGTIELESEAGRGSRFRVKLPVQTVSEADILGTDPEPGHVLALQQGQPIWRILAVDDQEENALLMVSLLEQVGFETKVARNGAEAIEQFQAWEPHFIWMDCRMPVLDGMEATRRIRCLEGGEKVKIVALTASVFREERDAVIACGMDDFLRKPCRPDELYAMMSKHLGVRYEYGE